MMKIITKMHSLLAIVALSIVGVMLSSNHTNAANNEFMTNMANVVSTEERCMDINYRYNEPTDGALNPDGTPTGVGSGMPRTEELSHICVQVDIMEDGTAKVRENGKFSVTPRTNHENILNVNVSDDEEKTAGTAPTSGTGKYLLFDCEANVWGRTGWQYKDNTNCVPYSYSEVEGLTWDEAEKAISKKIGGVFQSITDHRGDKILKSTGVERVKIGDNNTSIDWDTLEEKNYYQTLSDKGVTDPELLGQSTGTTGSSGSVDAGDNKDSCYSAAEGLGWVICSVSEFAGNLSNDAYDGFIEPALQIRTDLFTNDETYNAWQTFQSIANIIFVIMIIFVIFSQLTGLGIDNYGIKKTLPKLIIAIILINLSYIICELFIDASNIIGGGLKGIFDGLGENIQINLADSDGPITGLGLKAAIAAVVIIIGGATAWAIGPVGIVGAIALAAIALLIGILMLFVMLAVRQAAVLLLVIISPLAFVAYMLPNTKNLFDKWKNIFKTMLLLFPICGLMIGAGGYAGKIIMSAAGDNYFMIITGAVVAVAPIFFIPSVLRQSTAALGRGVNHVLGRFNHATRKNALTAADKGIKNSNWAKRSQAGWSGFKGRIQGAAGDKLSGNRFTRAIAGNALRRAAGKNTDTALRFQEENEDAIRKGTKQGRISAEAAVRSNLLAKQDKDNLAYINSGKITDAQKKQQFNNLIQKAMENYNGMSEDDKSMLRAYIDYYDTKKGAGREIMSNAITGAEAKLKKEGKKVDVGGANELASKLSGKDFKKDAPRLHYFAAKNLAEPERYVSFAEASAEGVDSLTEKMMSTMDDDALRGYNDTYFDHYEEDKDGNRVFKKAGLQTTIDDLQNQINVAPAGEERNNLVKQRDKLQEKLTHGRQVLTRTADKALRNPNNTDLKEKNRVIMQEIAGHISDSDRGGNEGGRNGGNTDSGNGSSFGSGNGGSNSNNNNNSNGNDFSGGNGNFGGGGFSNHSGDSDNNGSNNTSNSTNNNGNKKTSFGFGNGASGMWKWGRKNDGGGNGGSNSSANTTNTTGATDTTNTTGNNANDGNSTDTKKSSESGNSDSFKWR